MNLLCVTIVVVMDILQSSALVRLSVSRLFCCKGCIDCQFVTDIVGCSRTLGRSNLIGNGLSVYISVSMSNVEISVPEIVVIVFWGLVFQN